MSEEYREKYREKYSYFMKVLKRILIENWTPRTRSVWQGLPILQQLLQSHLPHYLLVCLAE